MNMTYQELNMLHKYLWNEVDSERFAILLGTSIPNTPLSNKYIDQKWQEFQRGPIQFAASFSTSFFNAALIHMNKINYKG